MIWNIDPIALQTSVISVRWYGIFLSAGMIASYYHLRWLMRNEAQRVAFQRVVPAAFLGSLLGARLGHLAFYAPALLLESPMMLVNFSEPGLASHGAIVGGTVAIWLVTRWREDINFLWFLSRIAFSFVIFCILIRLGNFFNSELIGTPSNLPWAVQFLRVDAVFRHPVQLYESAAYLICYGFMWVIYRRGVSVKGLLGGVLAAMSVLRISLETFKADQTRIEAEFTYTLGYLLTLPILTVGIVLLISAWLDTREPATNLNKNKGESH
ncbi:MAG: phosphatidylglycerol:prolipoprotein diacylglycerol transferase [Candidatus Pseudothioglobus sp.]|jgi:phosphatidylglycerol:prolipoprotein diacylglycerol transferase